MLLSHSILTARSLPFRPHSAVPSRSAGASSWRGGGQLSRWHEQKAAAAAAVPRALGLVRPWRRCSEIASIATAPGAATTPAPPYQGKHAVVVGAGPAGSTAAMFLARQGFSVDVYEKRPEPSSDAVDSGRAYIIFLIPRGQAALSELGVPLPTEGEYVTQGTVRHNRQGKMSITREEGNVTFSRSGLAQYMIDQARQRYPNQIHFHFEASCEGVDVAGRQATFTIGSSPGGQQQVQYDLLVGADGVSSAVRTALTSFYPDMTVEVTDSGRQYKTYSGMRGDIEPDEFKGTTGTTLHLWSSDDAWTTFTTHRNPDGTYSGTFSLKTGGFADPSMSSPAAYEQLLSTRFAGIPPQWIPQVAQQTFQQSPNPAGRRVKCSRLDGPAILLLGDAAHAVTPVFGQGCNSALESCKVLDQVLLEAGGQVDRVPQLFTAARLEDMHALNWLDTKAYSFFRRRGIFDPDFVQLLSHVVLGTILSKLLPFLYGRKPALLSLGTTTPYARITAAVKRDSIIAALGFAALGLWISFKLVTKFVG